MIFTDQKLYFTKIKACYQGCRPKILLFCKLPSFFDYVTSQFNSKIFVDLVVVMKRIMKPTIKSGLYFLSGFLSNTNNAGDKWRCRGIHPEPKSNLDCDVVLD